MYIYTYWIFKKYVSSVYTSSMFVSASKIPTDVAFYILHTLTIQHTSDVCLPASIHMVNLVLDFITVSVPNHSCANNWCITKKRVLRTICGVYPNHPHHYIPVFFFQKIYRFCIDTLTNSASRCVHKVAQYALLVVLVGWDIITNKR